MTRLIDADALKYELGDTRDGEPIFRPAEFVRMDVIEKAIDEAPTVERPHGEWIYHKEWEIDGECAFECSKCGMETDVDYNFCPNCGADMREEGDSDA